MLAGIIFENIADYKMLHSSQMITDAVIEAIRIGLPAAKDYLRSRMVESDHPLLRESYPKLKTRWRRETEDYKNPRKYGYKVAPIFGSVNDIQEDLFKKNRPK